METCTKIDNRKQVENKRIESSVSFKKYNENNGKLDSLSNKHHLVERNPTKNAPRDTYSIENSREIHSTEKYSDSGLGSSTNHFLLPEGAQYFPRPSATTHFTSSAAAATTNTYLAHFQEGAKKYASVDRPALWAPIFWSILPYLLSRCFGYSDFWIELAHLLISLFWLYLSIKCNFNFTNEFLLIVFL